MDVVLTIHAAVEGIVDEAVAQKLIIEVGGSYDRTEGCAGGTIAV